MRVFKRGQFWHVEFVFAGKRVQKSTKTTKKTVAEEFAKGLYARMGRALAGLPIEENRKNILSVREVIEKYLVAYENNHRPKSVVCSRSCLQSIKRLLGSLLLAELTEDRIHEYIGKRRREGVGGRTVNLELGELSRAIGWPWNTLWPNVRKLTEGKDVGRAIAPEEEVRLLKSLANVNSVLLGPVVRIALLTGLRQGEILSLRWCQIDFHSTPPMLTVGESKTAAGTGRQIPMNPKLFEILSAHAAWFSQEFSTIDPEWYLFPFGSPEPKDPTRHMHNVKTAWGHLRRLSGVQCRFHDLRHTFASQLARRGISSFTLKALMGHMSGQMLERYTHIDTVSKAEAMKGVSLPEVGTDSAIVPAKTPAKSKSLRVQ